MKLGFDNPLTGPQGQAGIAYQRGFQLALAAANNTIAGRPVDPMFVDDQAQADVGLTKVKGLVENDHVSAIIGFTFTPVMYAVATYIKQSAHVPMLVTTGGAGQALMLSPQFTSPYLMRFSTVTDAHADVSADWAYKQGFRKMVLITYDTAAGIEAGDLVASAFISRGGAVVQEFHPSFGTTDFGPFLAQLDPSADVVATWEPGADGLHMLQQFSTYTGQKRPTLLDMGGVATSGNLGSLGDQAVGVAVESSWVPSLNNPENQAFLKAWRAKYPSDAPDPLAAQGWGTVGILQQAAPKVNGNVENTQQFLQALYAVDVHDATGEVKLSSIHDIVRNIYISKIVKKGTGTDYSLLDTYSGVSDFWDRKQADLTAFSYGKLKGQWVGMTKDKLAQMHGLTGTPSS